MHDIADLEASGIPGVFVASAVFVEAAESQARALGFPSARVFVPHPIQDRTENEMIEYADEAVEALISSLTTCN